MELFPFFELFEVCFCCSLPFFFLLLESMSGEDDRNWICVLSFVVLSLVFSLEEQAQQCPFFPFFSSHFFFLSFFLSQACPSWTHF